MSIPKTDTKQLQLEQKVFTIGAGGTEEFTINLSEINAQLIDSKIIIEVVADSLDADVQLSQFQGNTNTFDSMSPILDTVSFNPIVTTISNGSFILISTTRAFFLGLELAKLTATVGTITVTIRA